MNCKLNLKAPNGLNSKLFKDITEVTKNPLEAVDLYFYTKTDDFKKFYKGTMDTNGEPIYSEFSKEAYLDEVDYNTIELDSSAEVYKQVLSIVPGMMSQIEDRIDMLHRSKGNEQFIKDLNDIYEVLDSDTVNNSIPKFLEMSRRHLMNLKNVAEIAANDTDSDIHKMANYYKVAQSYNSLSTLKQALSRSPEVAKLFETSIVGMNKTIGLISDVSDLYNNKTIEYLADQFNRRDDSWSKKEIKEALHNAPRDILWTEYTLEYMGDSRDRVLSMVARIMMEAEHTVRRNSIDFHKKLETQLTALENSTSVKGEEIFKDLLVEGPDGAWHIIHPEVLHTGGKNLFHDRMHDQLQKVKSNPALMEYLHFHTNTMKSLDSMLPSNAQMGTRLPTVLRSEWELLEGKTMKDKVTLIADTVKKKIQRSNLDMEKGVVLDSTGKPVRRIPTFYTQKYDSIDYDAFFKEEYDKAVAEGKNEEDAIDVADGIAVRKATEKMKLLVTKDLASSLQSFHAMATNYSAKNELVNIFDAAEFVVEQRTYNLVDSGGRTLKNKITGEALTKEGAKSNAVKQLTTFLDMGLYGQKEKDLGYFDVLGMKIDTNSTLRALNSSTGLIMQAGNVIAGLANIANGEYNNVMEAIGGEFFGLNDYHKGSGMYKDNIMGIMKDIGARTPSNIINLLEEHYNILQSFHGDSINTTERTVARRMMKTDTLYFIQGSGEHFMQIRAGLAMLNHTELFNAKGETQGTLLDAHKIVNGKLQVPTDMFIKDKDGKLKKFDTMQQDRVSNKIGAVLRKMHGNYSTETANLMQQDARTALIMKFRGWMYEGIKRRWGKKREYYLAETEMEGFYRTGGEAMSVLVKDMLKMQLTLTKEKWANMTPGEKANIRRFITETSAIVLLSAAGALLGKAGKLLDEEYNSDSFEDRLVLGSFQLFNYEVQRAFTEVAAYINPAEAIKLTRSPMAASSILENITRLVIQLQSPTEKYEAGWRKDQYKLSVRLEGLVPLYKQVMTLNADGIKDRGTWLE
jgi:hypothetical protein